MQTITTMITATIENIELFKDYSVDYNFVLGNLFNISLDSQLYTVYVKLFQEALDKSIECKEKDLQGFVLSQSIHQLLQPIMHTKPYMYDSFKFGILQQVSKETYGIYVNEFYKNDKRYGSNQTKLYLPSNDNIIVGGKDSAMIILRKGQSVENPVQTMQLDLKNCKEENEKDALEYSLDLGTLICLYIILNQQHLYYFLTCFILALVKLKPLDSSNVEDIVSLTEYSYDRIFFFLLESDNRVFHTHIILEMKHLNHASSVQFSIRMTGDNDSSENTKKCVVLGEQLTIAYF